MNLEEYPETVLFYINSCVDSVTVHRNVKMFSNQRPWMNKEVQNLLRVRNTAFKSGDIIAY